MTFPPWERPLRSQVRLCRIESSALRRLLPGFPCPYRLCNRRQVNWSTLAIWFSPFCGLWL